MRSMHVDPRLADLISAIAPLDAGATADAEARQAQLTKPAGALGVLEAASVRLSGIQRTCPPRPLRSPAVAVFAADHGVHAQGVTPWPQEVTASMVENFRAGGAAVNVLARQVGAEVYVVDMGVAADVQADERVLVRKVEVVEAALAARPVDGDPLTTLASVGGFEHAGLVGFVLGAAACGVPVVLDGVIAGSAALVVHALAPTAVDYCFAGHRSVEPGHAVALARLGLRPLVDLDLRLGEGTGALLAFPLVEAAGAVLREMATFDSAGVARK